MTILFAALHESAFGPKRTWARALHMSAFWGKADMAFCGISLSRSLLDVERTWLVAAHMSAFDPKRTSTRGWTPFCESTIRSTNISVLGDGPFQRGARGQTPGSGLRTMST